MDGRPNRENRAFPQNYDKNIGFATLNHAATTALLPAELYNGNKLMLLKGDFDQDFKSISNCVTQKTNTN